MADCKHDCDKPRVFPKAVFNRPALSQIDFRIGTYSRMREHMLDALNRDQVLQNWTHRGADDPGIALLEGNALVGDVLAFYQNLYANEAFLRTAEWRESIADLVQLTGYRLAPGVGGVTTFALKIKGDKAVVVPAGFGFKAQLQKRDQQDEFESTGQITAHPHLSEFHLYTPPSAMQNISTGANQLELHAVDGKKSLSDLQAVEFNKGDRVLLVPESDMFDITGSNYVTQEKSEVLIVESVETVLDRIVITFEGALRVNRSSKIRAYKIDRSFRHFGYNSAHQFPSYELTASGGIADVKLRQTDFSREATSGSSSGSSRSSSSFDYSTLSEGDMLVYQQSDGLSSSPAIGRGVADLLADLPIYSIQTYDATSTPAYSSFTRDEIPLDQEIDDLALGGKLICQGEVEFSGKWAETSTKSTRQNFIVVRTIEEVAVDTLRWASIEASSSVLSLDKELIANSELLNASIDICSAYFHEATSPELTLRASTAFPGGNFSDGNLEFFGTHGEVIALAERELLLVDSEQEITQRVRNTSKTSDFDAQLANRNSSDKWLWTVKLDQFPQVSREMFAQTNPAITVYGNLVDVEQGKTEDEVVLGSGDNRETFQTFAILKKPLTYLLDASRTPAQVPELRIYVDGILWRQVDTFFNSSASDLVYVVREDKDGNSLVQFGDGVTGARLSSGRNNVVALYRSGTGASGKLEQDKKPSATGKLTQLEKVFLPGEVVGGGEAETLDTTRAAAPARMQSLGRLVGLADFEAEALALPGVVNVRADWAAPQGTPLIRIIVLTETASLAAVSQVQQSLAGYNRCRGPARFPILVELGLFQYVYLNLRVGYAATYRQANVETAVKLALGQVGEEDSGIETRSGLFSLALRRFGQGAHRSQILSAVQQVDGVTWVEIDDAQAIELGTPTETDPAELVKPVAASTAKTIACLPQRILALHVGHLDLSLVLDATDKECE
ncbi:MAG: hypothetical protein GY819_13120 [Planctomycetaceae bacterium]|nr:hypothetical protein [Planctomycetaceae bacterium]